MTCSLVVLATVIPFDRVRCPLAIVTGPGENYALPAVLSGLVMTAYGVLVFASFVAD